jgi:hypothetical protein
MASVCHPDFWETLKGKNVKVWHLVNGDDFETVAWVAQHHPEGMESLIGGGSSVGMRAMNVSAALGFRRFDIHGMDCSFVKNRQQVLTLAKIRLNHGQSWFENIPDNAPMLQSAIEMEKFIETQDAEVVFYGDGLMQETAFKLKELA